MTDRIGVVYAELNCHDWLDWVVYEKNKIGQQRD